MIVRWLLGAMVACGGSPPAVVRVVDTVHDAPVVLSPNVTRVVVDASGALWAIGNRMGLTRRSSTGRVRHFTVREGLPTQRVHSVAPAPDGSTWIGTRYEVVRFDPLEERITPVPEFPDTGRPLLVGNDSEGNVIVAQGGVGLVRVGAQGMETLVEARALPPGKDWFTLVVDPDGVAWIGSERGGLWRAAGDTGDWVSSMPVTPIRGLALGPRGGVWIATQGEGLWVAPAGGEPVPADVDEALPRHLWDVAFGPQGELWVASEWEGLFHLADPEEPKRVSRPEGLPVVDALSLAHDGLRVWVGHAAGVSVVDADDVAHTVLEPAHGIGGRITALDGRTGGVVAATGGGGLVQVTPEGLSVHGRVDGVASNELYGVVVVPSEDGRPQTWAASLFGASRQLPGRGDHVRVGEAPGPELYAIAGDPVHGAVWVASRRGVDRIDVRTAEATPLLQGCEFPGRPAVMTVAPDGLWVGLSQEERNLLHIPFGDPCRWTAHAVGGGVTGLHTDPDVGLLVVGSAGLRQLRVDGSGFDLRDGRARRRVDYDPITRTTWVGTGTGLVALSDRGDRTEVPLPASPSELTITPEGVFASHGADLYWIHGGAVPHGVTTVYGNADVPTRAAIVSQWLVQARPDALSVTDLERPEDGRALSLRGHQVTSLVAFDARTVLVGTAFGGLLSVDLPTGDVRWLTRSLDGLQTVREIRVDESVVQFRTHARWWRLDGLDGAPTPMEPPSEAEGRIRHRGGWWQVRSDPPRLSVERASWLDGAQGPTVDVPLPECADPDRTVLPYGDQVLVASACGTVWVEARMPARRPAEALPWVLGLGLALLGPLLWWRVGRRGVDVPLTPERLRTLDGAAQFEALQARARTTGLTEFLEALGLPAQRAEQVHALVGTGVSPAEQIDAFAALLEADVDARAAVLAGAGARMAVSLPAGKRFEFVMVALDERWLRRATPRTRSDARRALGGPLGLTEDDVHTVRTVLTRRERRVRQGWPDPVATLLTPRSLGPLLWSPDPAASWVGQVVRSGVARHLSPYSTTGAVKSSDMFYGRAAALRTLLGAKASATLVVGPRRVGKSSLLAEFHRLLVTRSGRVVRVHLQGIETMEDLALRLAHAGGAPPPDDLDDLLRRWLEGGPVTLLLDEADGLMEGPDGEDIVAVLRRTVANGPLRVVLSGYLALYRMALDRRGPAYNFAEVVELGPLEPDASLDLAVEPMARLGMRWADASLPRALVERSGGYPYVIQLLCDEALSGTSAFDATLTAEHLDAACETSRVYDDFVWFVFRNTSWLTQWVCLRWCGQEGFSDHEVEGAAAELGVAPADLPAAMEPLLLYGYLRSEGEGRWVWSVPLFRELVMGDAGRDRTLAEVVTRIRNGEGPGGA